MSKLIGQDATPCIPVPARVRPHGHPRQRRQNQTADPAISSSPSIGCIDINTAGVPALVQIIHIGPVRAQQIVVLRRAQPFRSIQDLSRVDGISSARVGDIIAEGKACVSPFHTRTRDRHTPGRPSPNHINRRWEHDGNCFPRRSILIHLSTYSEPSERNGNRVCSLDRGQWRQHLYDNCRIE